MPDLPARGVVIHLAAVPLQVAAAASSSPAGDGPAAAAGDDPGAASGELEQAARRIISGQAVPWDRAAVVASDGVAYRFRPGSLRAARDRVPVLLSHDFGRPVGVVDQLEAAPDGLNVRLRIDATPDGDSALIQAASGSRAAISVGAAPLVFSLDGEVVDVQDAELAELSLVPVGAYPTATVRNVTATGGPIMPPEIVNGAASPPAPDAPAVAAAAPAPAPAPAPAAAAIAAAAGDRRAQALEVVPARAVVVTEAPRQRISANDYVAALIRAGGDPLRARELIQAATPPVTHTADVPGALPPNYTTDILGGLPPNGRPLASICTQRPMPASGMKLSKPVWGTLPNGGWMADDTAPPAYGVASITLREVPIEQWAWATGYSIAVQERTAPDYVDSVYQQAIESYYVDVEAKIAAVIEAAAAPAATIGAGVGLVGTTSHRSANVLIVSPDVLGEMIDAEGVIKYASASLDASGGSAYGLAIVQAPSLVAGSILVGVRGVVELRESTPLRLTATVVSGMNGELGVTSFATVDLEVTGAFAKCAAIGPPPVAPLARRSAS